METPEPELLRSKLAECEEALRRARRAEGSLAQLESSVRDFAIIVTSPDGRVLRWNEGAERIFGYAAEEMIAQTAAVLFTPEDRAAGVPDKEMARAADVGRAEDDMWLARKGGERFWASGVSSAIRNDGGELEGFVKVVRDQTQRKQLEDDLHRLNNLLEERVRARTSELEDALREMGAFAYSIAHDLRAPLRAMSGFSEVLAHDHADHLDDAGRDYLRRIGEAATRMDHMIEDLLDYSRITRADIVCEPLDAEPVIREALRRLAGEVEERQAEVIVPSPIPLVLGHRVALTQVFTNLISNALKFTERAKRPRVVIRAEPRGAMVRLWVEDNGIGIAPEHQGRIFGIFERLHPLTDFPGTGIGLAIVNRAVDRMKGRVGVESSVGKGSRFWIELRAEQE